MSERRTRKSEASERVREARALCEARGARLTPQRTQVLELLAEAGKPVSAYELMDMLSARLAKRVAPPTIYRALEFLVSHGLVSHLGAHNTYVVCAYPRERHDCVFFCCEGCGEVVEVADAEIERLLAKDAARLGFDLAHSTLEVQGLCQNCQG